MSLDFNWGNTAEWIEIEQGIDYCGDGMLRIVGERFQHNPKWGSIDLELMLYELGDQIREKCPESRRSIHTLLLSELQGLTDLSILRFFYDLKTLVVSCCWNLDMCAERHIFKLDEIELESVYIDGYHRSISFDRLPSAETIKHLYMAHAESLRVDGLLHGFPELKSLELRNGHTLYDLEGFRSFYNLESLKVLKCIHLGSVEKGSCYQNLKELVVDLQFVNDLRPIKRDLPQLQRLELRNGMKLEHLNHLCGMDSLEEFTAIDCPKLTDTSALSTMKRLKDYSIE